SHPRPRWPLRRAQRVNKLGLESSYHHLHCPPVLCFRSYLPSHIKITPERAKYRTKSNFLDGRLYFVCACKAFHTSLFGRLKRGAGSSGRVECKLLRNGYVGPEPALCWLDRRRCGHPRRRSIPGEDSAARCGPSPI